MNIEIKTKSTGWQGDLTKKYILIIDGRIILETERLDVLSMTLTAYVNKQMK